MNERGFDNINRPDKSAATPSGTQQRQKDQNDHTKNDSAHSDILDRLHSAASESSQPLEPAISTSLSQQLGHDFSKIRIHNGPASAKAAESIGARAYTLGNRIHLGEEAHSLSRQEHNRLLVHEAVHTVQQGGRDIAPSANLDVSSPNDAAEQEAHQIADTFTPNTPSPSLGLRDQLRASISGQRIARAVAPQIQRDLTGKKSTIDGDFDLNLKTESNPGAKSGLKGTIKFKASQKSPDSTSIRLLQIARLEDLTTGKDYTWTGGEANRNKVMTTASKDVTPGYFVDLFHAKISPRTKKTDKPVSPYYVDYVSGAGGLNKDGSKKGKTVHEASLWDYPGWSRKSRFSFETAAKAADTGYVYATLRWGFTISDPAKGKVENEHASAHLFPSKTFSAAVEAFDVFYKNPGASTAP